MDFSKIIKKFDDFQQRHSFVGFPLAVVKKFSDDDGSYQAALITYYGFLSLFPLLLVVATLVQIWFGSNPNIQHEVARSIQDYLPILGDHLHENVHSSSKTGISLVIGLILALLGARGGADALRFALNTIWGVPKNKRTGFPHNIVQSFAILACGAVGFIASIGVSSLTSILGQSWEVKLGINIIGVVIVGSLLTIVFRIATAHKFSLRAMAPGAFMAAFAIQILATFGGLLVKNQLKNLGSLYGTFALVLGLLFWIYLLARIIVAASVIDSVRVHRLWPRSLDSKHPTNADEHMSDHSLR